LCENSRSKKLDRSDRATFNSFQKRMVTTPPKNASNAVFWSFYTGSQAGTQDIFMRLVARLRGHDDQ
jgi:hypothetical protein